MQTAEIKFFALLIFIMRKSIKDKTNRSEPLRFKLITQARMTGKKGTL